MRRRSSRSAGDSTASRSGIELAAARTRLLDPVALLAQLETVLDALGTGPVDLPERQRTLRATVEWSFGLLDEAEHRLLATLSVFADGWTIGAAADVAADTEDARSICSTHSPATAWSASTRPDRSHDSGC